LDCKGFRKKLSLPDWVTMQAFAEMDWKKPRKQTRLLSFRDLN
jgi:hypothetical protein